MESKMKKMLLVSLVMLFAGTSAFAGFSVTAVTGAGDVLTDGTLVEAVNFGGGDATLNGLTFTGSGTDISVFSQTGGTGIRADVAGGYKPDTGGLADFVGLLNVGAWQKGTKIVGNTLTLHLTGLDIGEDYRFQLFAGETRVGDGHHPMTVTVQSDTSETYTYGPSGIAKTIRVDAYFAALTQDVDIELTIPDYDGPLAGGLMFHAYALHSGVVPEPATMVLLGLGSLVLRKRRK